jgi:hypothetical protein
MRGRRLGRGVAHHDPCPDPAHCAPLDARPPPVTTSVRTSHTQGQCERNAGHEARSA